MIAINRHLIDPDPSTIGDNPYEFLQFLGGPATIILSGKDPARCRAFITLLHGNEPSGTIALFRWLKSGLQPSVNIVCIIASVEAALSTPEFSKRVLSPQRDLNRCFNNQLDDEQGHLAASILETIRHYKPEAAIDMHNTSGSGPAFAVATHVDKEHDALASLFTQRLIITHLRLGALMEISEYLCPTVTIECGGRLDETAHEIAWEGIQQFFTRENVLGTENTAWGLEILNNPVRLELVPGCKLSYGNQGPGPLDSSKTVILDPALEHLNAGITAKDTCLGWVNTGNVRDVFSAHNSEGECVVSKLIYIDEGKLRTRQDLKLFMVTTNAEIAMMDCLFYAVDREGAEID